MNELISLWPIVATIAVIWLFVLYTGSRRIAQERLVTCLAWSQLTLSDDELIRIYEECRTTMRDGNGKLDEAKFQRLRATELAMQMRTRLGVSPGPK